MPIKIPVSAQFDAADLKQQIQMVNDQIRVLASQVGQANNQKFEPINVKSKEDLDGFIKQMQKLLKIQTELKTTMSKTGQGHLNPLMADWKKMYGDQAERIKKMQSMLQFLGVEFDDNPKPKPKPPSPTPGPNPTPNPTPPVPSPHGGGYGWRHGWGGQGVNVMQSGLNAFGPVGGVMSNALGSGLSGGAGAGLMGLVGGLAALGVGKLIGAIADKVGQAQDNAIGLDKLYRQVGGVASYSALKNSIGGPNGLADSLGMKTSDAITMASTYTRANLRPGENAMTGLLTAGGTARTLGLDPNSVAGSMAQMRGANIGRSDQDTRRMGALIGEAIGKSGAFGQANEALEAITNYATIAARQSLTGPNVAGYGGALSGLMQTGLPGMDVQGAASLLSRVNAALTRGGNMGEASQAFTARMGMNAGLNPYQLRSFQETGMFGTLSSAFGADTPYGRAFGAGPKGSTTMFDMVKRQMGRQYGQGTPEYYMALANHLGTGVNEAMTLSNTSMTQLTGADTRAKRLGLNVNPQLMAQMGVIEGGGAALGNMARDYLGRKDLTDSERGRLMGAYQGNDSEKLKDVMAELVSVHGGTRTEGSQIRDNVAKLDNTFTRFADRALPSLDVMRMALVKMTGGSEDSLRSDYEKGMRQDQLRRGQRKYGWRIDAYGEEMKALQNKGVGLQTMGPEGDRYRALKEQQRITQQELASYNQQGFNAAHSAAYGNGLTATETGALDTSSLGDSPAAMIEAAKAQLPENVPGDMMTRAKSMDKDIQDAAKKYDIRPELLRGLIAQESKFDNQAVSPAGAIGAAQIVPKWNKKYMEQYDINTQRGNIMIGAAHLRDDLNAAGGDEYEALRRYNGGTGDGRKTQENIEYAPKVLGWTEKLRHLNRTEPETTPPPEQALRQKDLPGAGDKAAPQTAKVERQKTLPVTAPEAAKVQQPEPKEPQPQPEQAERIYPLEIVEPKTVPEADKAERQKNLLLPAPEKAPQTKQAERQKDLPGMAPEAVKMQQPEQAERIYPLETVEPKTVPEADKVERQKSLTTTEPKAAPQMARQKDLTATEPQPVQLERQKELTSAAPKAVQQVAQVPQADRPKELNRIAQGTMPQPAWVETLKDLNRIDPKTMTLPGGRIDIKAAPLEVQHRDSSGQVTKTEQLPLSSSFSQSRSFATR